MSISAFISAATGTVVLCAALLVSNPTPVDAWKVGHDASSVSVCADKASQINWLFSNTEPNEAKYIMDVVVTNTENNQSVTETVKPGESASGSFDIDKTQIDNGSVSFKMLWTNGRGGVDVRSSEYAATEVCYEEPTEKTVEVCRDDKVVEVLESDRDDSDTNTCPVEEVPEPKTPEVVTALPKTGATMALPLVASALTYGVTFAYSSRLRRK